MANAPLSGSDGGDMKVICGRRERKYFCKGGWTGTAQNNPVICSSGCLIEPTTVYFRRRHFGMRLSAQARNP